jgi:SprT protein
VQAASDRPSEWLALIARWAVLWRVPGLEQRLTVSFSPRLRRSLGRCVPAKRIVRLNVRLLHATAALLEEVLCHEVAHVAVHELHVTRCRPHGPEWAALMRAAGFEPRVRARLSHDAQSVVRPARADRPLYEHRCPVCQAVRMARRPVPQWRCAACLAARLDGRLLIAKHTGAPR